MLCDVFLSFSSLSSYSCRTLAYIHKKLGFGIISTLPNILWPYKVSVLHLSLLGSYNKIGKLKNQYFFLKHTKVKFWLGFFFLQRSKGYWMILLWLQSDLYYVYSIANEIEIWIYTHNKIIFIYHSYHICLIQLLSDYKCNKNYLQDCTL